MAKKKKLKDIESQMQKLMKVGLALSSERELPNLVKVLLDNSMEVTGAEGASVYLIETKSSRNYEKSVSLARKPYLRFYRSKNRRIGTTERSGILEVDSSSIAGHVVHSKETLNIENCYDLPEDSPYTFNPNFDKESGYASRSMLAIPMVNGDGKVRGVIQLINKLSPAGLKAMANEGVFSEEEVQSFTATDEELMRVFATHAAIAIENSQLTQSIENLFESFVRASIKAIEARDPTTSGHSDRVAMMTVELAIATHKSSEAPYRDVQFSEEQLREIRYAALLHDFGKIGVSEPILLKKKKLYDRELESILIRLDSMVHKEENELWKSLCERFVEAHKSNNKSFDPELAFQQAQMQVESTKSRLKALRSQVITANEPQILSADFDINKLVDKIVSTNDLFSRKVLTMQEIKTLSIPRGSLSRNERIEIESHVSHTYEFLKQIAWTEDLSHVATIAHCHHEKMDGTGYPRGLENQEIPIQARMMTIADIYDALTAFDRPYKKSLPPARALEILVKDARNGKIDGHLLKIFIEAGVFHHATLGTMNLKVS